MKKIARDSKGNKLYVGDLVTIVGDLNISHKIVYVTSTMKRLINDGNIHPIKSIKERGEHGFTAHAGGFHWSTKNQLRKDLTESLKMTNGKKAKFDISNLVT